MALLTVRFAARAHYSVLSAPRGSSPAHQVDQDTMHIYGHLPQSSEQRDILVHEGNRPLVETFAAKDQYKGSVLRSLCSSETSLAYQHHTRSLQVDSLL